MKSSCFTFEKKLGAGAFGTAFLVRNKSTSIPYVIKEQFNTSYTVIENEVKLLKKMRHPNIIAYYDFWREGNRNFILMEYAARGTLRDILERRATPFKEEEALYLFSQIVLGVHHIHKRLVLHRDLKPENILLTGRRADIIKIGDFGVSKDVTHEPGLTRVGTKVYMAPEVLQGYKYDYKCDIWSIGIVFYEMITKMFPFNTRNHLQMIKQICRGLTRPIPQGSVSYNSIKLFQKMLRVIPEERPSARQLVLCSSLMPFIKRVYISLSRNEKMMMLGINSLDIYVGK